MKKILIIAALIFVVLTGLKYITPPKSLETYAEEIVQKCKTTNYRPGCYETEIPALMQKLSMEEAFEVTRFVKQEDKDYKSCHVLGHKLSSEEVKKNPDAWKELPSRCPSNVCTNGCIHGGMQERFRKESLSDAEIEKIKSDLKTVCEKRNNWNPTRKEQGSCYHALGHLTMYITRGNLKKSLSLCSELAKTLDGRNLEHLCFNGAFMQIYQPLEKEDFDLIKGREQTKDTVTTFCSAFAGEENASCWSESWPLVWKEIKNSPTAISNFCSYHTEENMQRGCFIELFNLIAMHLGNSHEKIKDYCTNLPILYQNECLAQEASRMIKTNANDIDNAIALCKQAPNGNGQRNCFKELSFYIGYNFHQNSQKQLCSLLPQPFNKTCPQTSAVVLREEGIF